MFFKPSYTLALLLIYFILFAATPSYSAGEEIIDLSATLRLLWGLLVVLGILFLVYVIAKKKLNFLQTPGKGIINVVEVRHLMPKKSLYLVEVRGKEYLIGSGGDSLKLIAAIGESPADSFTEILDHSKKELAK